MYRPQFAYPTPAGCRDEDFCYFFDGSNVPVLNIGDLQGVVLENIPLVLEQDAPFYWRGWKFGALRGVNSCPPVFCPPVFNGSYRFPGGVLVKLRDCYENNLQDNWVPAVHSGFSDPLQFNDQLLQGPPTLIEPEIYCPPGGVILAFLRGPVSTQPEPGFPSFTLYGVKRFKDCTV